MSKFDLVERFNFWDLLSSSKKITLPHELFKKEGIIKDKAINKINKINKNNKNKWQPYYFNWGRNALFFLFKNLPFKKISFPAFTCPTLTEAAEAAGKEIELLEINPKTFNLDLEKLKGKRKKIECLVAVHTFGNPLDIKKIKKILPKTLIIEDCAHALFSQIKNKSGKNEYLGHQGDIILFSLYKQIPNINGSLLLSKQRFQIKQEEESLLTYPKRILVKTKGVHQRLLELLRKTYLPKIEQFNYNENQPNKIIFVLFEKKFTKLKDEVVKRRKIAHWYKEELKHSKFLSYQQEEIGSRPSFYQFPVSLKKPYVKYRDQLGLFLRENNFFVDRLWFDAPITASRFKKFQKTCPQALSLSKSVLNLPIKGDYQKEEVTQFLQRINDFFETIG